MASKCILFLFSLLIVGILSSTTSTARLIGGYEPIKDPNSPKVVEIAKFAVSEHNKAASSDLVYVKVLSGETQVVHGTNYKLHIAAKAAKSRGDNDVYEAIVYVNKSKTLVSFHAIN